MTTVHLTFPIEWDGGVVAHVEIEVDLEPDSIDSDMWDFGEIRADMTFMGETKLRTVTPGSVEHSEITHWIIYDSAACMACDEAWRMREPSHREYEAA